MRRLVEPIEHAAVLDGPARGLAGLLDKVLKPGVVRDALRGRWLGHPVHPMLTDLPIGFWTASWVLDVAGGKRARAVSDAMLGLGLAAAVPTVAAGLADFARGNAPQRRVALVHGSTMLVTSAIYARALSARGDRKRRFLLGQLGAATATGGAALGGYLVYAMGAGVRRRAG